ncbi:MAG TPA: hypothetical protein VGI19_19375 [Candidatus Cybelea sp.]|jgi:hypothetical protein
MEKNFVPAAAPLAFAVGFSLVGGDLDCYPLKAIPPAIAPVAAYGQAVSK